MSGHRAPIHEQLQIAERELESLYESRRVLMDCNKRAEARIGELEEDRAALITDLLQANDQRDEARRLLTDLVDRLNPDWVWSRYPDQWKAAESWREDQR